MEISDVRRRVKRAMDEAREQAQIRRQHAADAQRAYTIFLESVATPIVRQVAGALKAEGRAFTVFTPGGGLRLAYDRGRDDFIEFALDTDGQHPHVIGRVSYTRGSRTITDERPIKKDVTPEWLTEEDVLEYLLVALEPWLDR